MVPALGDSTGISIFIDSRITISPSASTLSPGLAWIFQTLPAISDFTLTTAMPRWSPPGPVNTSRSVGRFFRHRERQRKGRAADATAEPVCSLVELGDEAL